MGGANQDERREHGLSRSFIATTVAGRSINSVPRTAAAWGQKKSSGLLKHGAVRRIPEALEVSGLTHRQSTQFQRRWQVPARHDCRMIPESTKPARVASERRGRGSLLTK